MFKSEMSHVRQQKEPCSLSQKTDRLQSLEDQAWSERRKWIVLQAIAVALLCFVVVSTALSGQTDTARTAGKQTPKVVVDGTARLVGHYNSAQKVRLAIGLKPPHMAEEQRFLQELHKKGSSEFHHFLAAQEWNARFGPSVEDEQAVADWAESQGLTVTHRYSNRLLVDVEAPANNIEKAFGVTMNSYQLGAASFFSNDRDPVLPAHLLSAVQSVGGLNNLHVLHPENKNAREPAFQDYAPESTNAAAGSGVGNGSQAKLQAALSKTHHSGISSNITNGAYDPTDLYSSEAYDTNALYNLGHCCNPLGNAGGSPIESSIAIATAGTQSTSDVQGFFNQYPYLAFHWQQIYVDGTPSCCDEEGTVDIEWATAMSNSFGSYTDTATVYLYDGVNSNFSTFNDIYNRILNDNKTRVLMTGWGCAEISCYDSNDMAVTDSIFNQMAGMGWTIVAPTGNQGATAGCGNTTAVEFPGSDPNVIAVGGTSLSLGFGPSYNSEVGLTGGSHGCASDDGGGGGGQSAYFAAPDYQYGSMRTVPDIALNADTVNAPQNFFFDGALLSSGGTDFGAAEMAGFFAQENAYLVYLNSISSDTPKSAGNANYAIYDAGNTGTQVIFHYPFYDITSGCNNNDITATYGLEYNCATTGYDEVTGWGSVNMLQLAWAINTIQAGDLGPPSTALSGPTTGQWYKDGATGVSWVVTDTAGGGSSIPTGVAGYSAAWDADLGDVTSEATPGTANPFYSGPWTVNSANGSLTLASTTQGCHTLHLIAWDNDGNGSMDSPTYGPLCYDSVPPTSGKTQSPTPNSTGWNKTAVQVKLTASDPGTGSTGSGLAATYYAVDNAACSSTNLGACQVYSSPLNITAQANHTVQFFSKDKAGNFGSVQSTAVKIDETVPSAKASLSGSKHGTSYTTAVLVTLSASDNLSGVASVVYQLDGGAQQTYVKAFTVSAIGKHTVTFHATDKAGNVEGLQSVGFTIAIGPTTTKLVSSLNPSTKGKAVTFTATVTPTYGGAPLGTVSFKDGTTVIGTGTLSPTTHQVTFSTSTLTAATHSITAVYAGSTNFSASTSAVLKQVVNP